MTADELGSFINSFPMLEVGCMFPVAVHARRQHLCARGDLQMVAVRENPCMDPLETKRMELLSRLPALRSHQCRLHIVDFPVTLDERITAWKMAGATDDELEEFRAACALAVRSAVQEDPLTITTLDLENTNLHHVDLSKYRNLKHVRCAVPVQSLAALCSLHSAHNVLCCARALQFAKQRYLACCVP